ncbi:MAG: ribose-phosphate diphosphokinase [Bacteroidota bacterium]
MLQLYAGTASQALGQEIAEYLGQSLGVMQMRRFSDGELYPQFEGSVKGKHVCLVQSTYPPADHLMELLLTIDAARQAGASYMTAIIPYLGYMRQDRAHHVGGAIGAQLQARLLAAAGVDRLITCDLHAPHIVGFFDFPVHHLAGFPVFMPVIQSLQLPQLTFVAPDEGSLARTKQYAAHLGAPLVRCKKLKAAPNQVTTIQVQGEVKDADVVLIDDIVDTGRTICLAAQRLKAQGARTVRAFCTHAVLSGDAHARLAEADLEALVVTDTIPLQKPVSYIQVYSLAPLIARTLRQIIG